MAIYCMHCGKELPDDADFCLKCGTQVGRLARQATWHRDEDERELYRTELSKWDSLYPTQILLVTTKRLVWDRGNYLDKHEILRRPLDEIESLRVEVWDPNSRRAQNGCPSSVFVQWKGNPKDYWELGAKMHESYTHGIALSVVGHANEIMEAIQKARRLAGLL